MTPTNEASPKGRGQETEWRQARTSPNSSEENTASDWSEEDGNPSGEDRFRAALAAAHKHEKETLGGDDSHQKDRQVAGTKHQGSEIPPENQRRPKAIRYQEFATEHVAIDANNVPPNVQTKSKIWQGASVKAPSPYGAGFITNLDPSMTQEQGPQNLIDRAAEQSPLGQVVMHAAPTIKRRRGNVLKDMIEGPKGDNSRVGKYPVQLKSRAATQTQPVTRSQDSRIEPPAQVHIEDTGNSRTSRDEASTDPDDETPSTAPLMGTKDDHYPDWQELIDVMDLSKSRLLENESVLNFLRSLEPRIVDGSQEYFKPLTLFLSLAMKANIAKRRERFEEYLVEAPREWYCFTTVCKYGYESENALASKENCGCPQKQQTCLQVRIRRGKLGAFDVRFR